MTRLEQLRLDHGLTREQLARETGVAPKTIWNLENGRRAQMPTLARLSTYFAVPASQLLRNVDPLREAA